MAWFTQKATFTEHDQAPGQAAQEVMEQVTMLQRERDAAIRERQLYRQLLYKQLQPSSKNKQDSALQDEQSPAVRHGLLPLGLHECHYLKSIHLQARLQAMIDKYATALNFE